MIQGLAKKLAVPASRRVYAVLIAALLNLALVPCAMALEVIEEGHDCCPAEVNLELPECCELDDVSVDKRDGLLEAKLFCVGSTGSARACRSPPQALLHLPDLANPAP
jgi:hypothetical protein